MKRTKNIDLKNASSKAWQTNEAPKVTVTTSIQSLMGFKLVFPKEDLDFFVAMSLSFLLYGMFDPNANLQNNGNPIVLC
jgi:hypothetical protein